MHLKHKKEEVEGALTVIPSVRLDEKIGGTKSLENVLYLI